MADHSVTLVVTGARGDELSASVFAEQLTAFLAALQASEVEAAGRTAIEWVVTSMRRSSPAVVELEPSPTSTREPEVADATVAQFFYLLETIQERGDLPRQLRRSTIRRFRDLGKPVKQGSITSLVRNGQRESHINATLTPLADAALAPAQFAEGYVEGQLQWVNTHGGDLLMWIYPWVGPVRIKCKLRPEHVEDAGAALDKWVRVHGTLKYPAHSKHPIFIDVSRIEKLPDKVPSLEDMEGIALNATEGEPSDAFVRRLRDGW